MRPFSPGVAVGAAAVSGLSSSRHIVAHGPSDRVSQSGSRVGGTRGGAHAVARPWKADKATTGWNSPSPPAVSGQ